MSSEELMRGESIHLCVDEATVIAEPDSGDEEVNVWMDVHLLIPGVEEGNDARQSSHELGVREHLCDSGHRGLEQEVPDQLPVEREERPEGRGERKDELVVLGVEEVLLLVVEPLLDALCRARSADPVSTAVREEMNRVPEDVLATEDQVAERAGSAFREQLEDRDVPP